MASMAAVWVATMGTSEGAPHSSTFAPHLKAAQAGPFGCSIGSSLPRSVPYDQASINAWVLALKV